MPELQPYCMIVDRLDEYWQNAGAVCSQCVRKNLVSHQSTFRRFCRKLPQTGCNAFGKRLFCVGDTGNVIGFAKKLHSVFPAIGHNAKLNILGLHLLQPGKHRFCRDIRSVRHQGVIEIQHYHFDTLAFQKCRGYVCNAICNPFG